MTNQRSLLESRGVAIKHKDRLDAVIQELANTMKDADKIGVGVSLAVADTVQELVNPNAHINSNDLPRALIQVCWPLCLFQHLPEMRDSHFRVRVERLFCFFKDVCETR